MVLPSDHLIDDVDAFVADAGRAFEAAGRERVLAEFTWDEKYAVVKKLYEGLTAR